MIAKENTERKARSQAKKAVDTVGREFFYLYCEDNGILENTMKNLIDLSNDEEDKRIRLDANKFIAEQLIGKPKQTNDFTSNRETITPSLVFGNILKEGDEDVPVQLP